MIIPFRLYILKMLIQNYDKYCEAIIFGYIRKNKVLQCYLFLIDNIAFIQNRQGPFKGVTIEKARELIPQCDDKINQATTLEKKNKYLNIKNVLQDYLQLIE